MPKIKAQKYWKQKLEIIVKKFKKQCFQNKTNESLQ